MRVTVQYIHTSVACNVIYGANRSQWMALYVDRVLLGSVTANALALKYAIIKKNTIIAE